MAKKDIGNIAAIEELTEKLTEVMLQEANPDNWTGGRGNIKELTAKERSTRVEDKRDAAATVTLLVKIHSLIDVNKRTAKDKVAAAGEQDDADELSAEMQKAMKEAKKVVAKALGTH